MYVPMQPRARRRPRACQLVRMPKAEMEIMAHMARREMAFMRQPTPSRDW